MKKHVTTDLLIVGGGVTGAACAFAALYTNIKNITLVEMGGKYGAVNTAPQNNSQTLHDGSIETNYSPEKAAKVAQATNLLVKYLHDYASNDVFSVGQKMVIAVGPEEVAELRTRFEAIKHIYPGLELLDRKQIWFREPKVIEGRPLEEEIIAVADSDGYTIDFQKLSESFIHQASKSGRLSQYKNTKIVSVSEKTDDGYVLTDQHGNTYTAKVVVFATGPHSLLFAKQMGYAKHLGLLPVAGSFFSVPKQSLLRGKVYTMQKPKLPFAAVHGDPEIFDPTTTRFGPTAKVLPMLMRHKYSTVVDFLKVSVPTWAGITTLFGILADKIMALYMLRNLAYDLWVIGKWVFLQDAKKIIPTLKYSDLKYNSGTGGIRPQIVNTETGNLEMGDAKVVGDNVIFSITPSPGASTCLSTALFIIQEVVDFLPEKIKFNQKAWEEDFKTKPEPVELE